MENTAELVSDGLLISFAEELERGTATVGDWSGRYPALARDFARLASESFATAPAGPSDNASVERLRLAGRTRLAALRPRFVASPLESLIDRARNITPARIAAQLGLPTPYVAKLERRLFAPSSIPSALIQRLADTIERSFDEVAAYLAAPPTLARAAAYRSDAAPTIGSQEDFQAILAGDHSVSPDARSAYGGG